MEEFVEGIVCNVNDVEENEMKVFNLDEGEVLMVKQEGTLYAVGSKCTHYDARMVSGVLGKGCLRCPLHGARFDLKTGDIEDFPGLDSLPCFQVSVLKDGNVKVRAKKSELKSSRRIKPMAYKDPENHESVVIIGGGPSAAVCAETLRQSNFTGRITIVCEEPLLPYDRVVVSKDLNAPGEEIQLRKKPFYDEYGIDYLIGVKATGVDTSNKEVALSNNSNISYTKLYIATGCRARVLNVNGGDLDNVYTLRTISDANNISKLLNPDVNVVILGTSFIGMEAANYCTDANVKSVTIVGLDVPFKPIFGEEIGLRLIELFEEKGIEFRLNTTITECIGDGQITGVKLSDGTTLAADLLIVGIGSVYNSEFLSGSGVDVREDGTIPVNDRMETNIEGVYAGGDIAYAPVASHDVSASIEHFGLAQLHGRIAALNIAGQDTQLKAVPFFWTRLFRYGIIYCGHGKYADIKFTGSLADLKFVAYYLDKTGKVIAIASCKSGPIVSKFAEYLVQRQTLNSSDLLEDTEKWTKKILN